MITSHASISASTPRRPWALVGASLLLAGILAGCGGQPLVTHSVDARREGMTRYDDGDYADAAGSFRNAIRQNPRDYQSHYWLGQCYEQLGMQHQAIQAYKSSLDTQKTTLEGRENLAYRVQTLGGLANAIAKSDLSEEELNAAEQRAQEKQSAEDYILVAKISRARGDVDSALDAYNRAMLLEPKNFYSAKEYGLYLEQVGQQQKALVPLKRAYSMNSGDTEVADALRRLGIVPGPSLRNERELAGPPVPKGPIPEVDWSKMAPQSKSGGTAAPAPSATPPPQTVEAPRD